MFIKVVFSSAAVSVYYYYSTKQKDLPVRSVINSNLTQLHPKQWALKYRIPVSKCLHIVGLGFNNCTSFQMHH